MPDLELRDCAPLRASLPEEVLRGLGGSAKSLPCKYFYDEVGSRLFERICELEEYYLTRTELRIMRRWGPAMARQVGPHARLVEPGSGSGQKTRLLLALLEDPVAYVPIDISREYLLDSSKEIAEEFPGVRVQPLCADYTGDLTLPPVPDEAETTLVYYPGSTIGNFDPDQARAFLGRLRRMAGSDGVVLIGVDLNKDPAVLLAAYDDAEGVTAEFNLNLLVRINRELGADFDPRAFAHRAVYEERPSRVVIQLVSRVDQTVTVAGSTFEFAAGEAITTEHSHKPSVEDFARLARSAGLAVHEVWTDERDYFSVQLLRPVG